MPLEVDGSKTFLQMFYFTCNHGLTFEALCQHLSMCVLITMRPSIEGSIILRIVAVCLSETVLKTQLQYTLGLHYVFVKF